MHLSGALGMEQDAVLCVGCAAQRFVHHVVVGPACYVRKGLIADGAEAALFFPEVQQPPSSVEGLCHLYAKVFFKVAFPGWIVGIAISFDLFVPGYGCCGGQAEPVVGGVPFCVFCLSEEAPVPVAGPSAVPILHPACAFCRVSPPCPAPQGLENGSVDMGKGFLGRGVSVKVCPSPSCGIEGGNQPVGRGLFVLLDDLSEVRQERFDVLFRWACKEFPIVLTDMLSEKVKPVLNVRYAGFLFREFQASFPQKIGDEGLDLLFQDLFRDTCNEEVVTIAHQIDLLVHTFQGLWP